MAAHIRFYGGPMDGYSRPFAEPLPNEVIVERPVPVPPASFRGDPGGAVHLHRERVRYVLVRYTLGHGDCNPFYVAPWLAEDVRSGRLTIRNILGY